MNYDEFAFFNQQLAAMLRDGLPLEGALKQLSAGMRRGPLQAEIQRLEADLSRGTPLKEAMQGRSLPEFYRQMVTIGARSNDLPGMLTLLADHYHRANALWTRLKGLLVYPLIVIVVSLGLTLLLSFAFSKFQAAFLSGTDGLREVLGGSSAHGGPFSPVFLASMWAPPVLLAVAALLFVAAVSLPSWRAWLRWRLPAFREASLAQLASAMALMLKNGTTLAEALAMAETMEAATPAGQALRQWCSLVEAGQGKPAQWPRASRPFPALFLWLVQKGGEDVAAGFRKAADIYQSRAAYRIELALYGALPISILLLGQMVLWQATPLLRSLLWMMNMLSSVGEA